MGTFLSLCYTAVDTICLILYAQSLLDLRGNDFVICNDYGFPINPDSYGALVRRVGKKAGIEKIHPHMFRHTFCCPIPISAWRQ